MSRKKPVVPEAKQALERFKLETAQEIGVDVSAKPDMGNFTSKEIGAMAKTGRLGGRMVRKMAEQAEETLVNKNTNNVNS